MSRRELECLADSGTTHTILRNRQLFTELFPFNSSVTTITGSTQLIKGRGTAQFLLPNGTLIQIADALYAPRALRTLISFKDIRANGYHLETHCENGIEEKVERIVMDCTSLRFGSLNLTQFPITHFWLTTHKGYGTTGWDTRVVT